MLVRDLAEIRICFPAHALVSIDPLVGVIDNSEHDFLQDKLGKPLYDRLCKYYDEGCTHVKAEGPNTSYWNRLLLMSQRCIVFDAFGRAIGTHAISVSNAGVNVSVADDYVKPDKEAIDTFRNTCSKEAHSAVNRLLATLEEWTQLAASNNDSSSSDESETPDYTEELNTIVSLWKKSRYFYLAADLLIPSSMVLQEYLNHYDSKEKFIQMLPDLRYIQEEMLVPAIGEELTDFLVEKTQTMKEFDEESPLRKTKPLTKAIHAARKFMATALEERTRILRTDNNRRAEAHDERVRLLQSLKEYIADHQDYFLKLDEAAMKESPLYVDPKSDLEPYPTFENNTEGNAIFVTPPLR